MLGTHFDLAKEVAAIAARNERAALSDSPRDVCSGDPTFGFGTPAELDYLLDQFAGREPKIRTTGASRG